MTMASRIEQAMRKADLNQTEIAALLKISPQAVQQWTVGKTAPKGARLVKLAKILNVDVSWLLLGSSNSNEASQRIESNATWLGDISPWDSDNPLDDDEVELPFFREVELSAGPGICEVQENHGCKLRFSKLTLKKYRVSEAHAACVVVSGNSMEPVLPDGCTIGIDTSKKAIINGKMYAIDHDGHLRVKILYNLPGGGIRMRSYNSAEWPDEPYPAEQLCNIRILGKVFWYSVLLE